MSTTLDFSAARVKHLAWKTRLRSFLDGRETMTEAQATSPKECDLGKWLYNEGLGKHSAIPEMRQLESMHSAMHAEVKKVIVLKHAGNNAQAETSLGKVDELSAQILKLLEAIQKKV